MNEDILVAQSLTPTSSLWSRLRRFFTKPTMILTLLAAQFAIVQLLTGTQFGDAPRNLHWGIFTFEQPSFLISGVDTFERNKGFPPDPVTLGPRELWRNPPAGFHRWWGPVAPLLFAAVWGLTRSYTLLQLVIPVLGAATVLCTYWLSSWLMDSKKGLLAAAFLSCYPLFREYSVISYTETLSALVLCAAFFAYLRGNTWLTLIAGTICALCKMDLLAIYTAVIGVCFIASFFWRESAQPFHHQLISLFGPALLSSPWVWFHYLNQLESSPTAPLSFGLFQIIVPMMLNLTFYSAWFVTLLTLALFAGVILVGIRAKRIPRLPALLLGTWLLLGFLITLVYCATPGAGNSPRVMIPALPALAILFASGFSDIPARWKRALGTYLIALFLFVNLAVIAFQAISYGAPIRAAGPAFAQLRSAPDGFVLTPIYWETILYTRHQATWFEFDTEFEQNIMQNEANFTAYITQHPIRYVLLPDAENPASEEVLAYLSAHSTATVLGNFTLYELP